MSQRWNRETAKAQGLHKRDRAMLRELGDMARANGLVWAGQEALGYRLGMCERTVRTALKNLEAAGWIERTKRHRKDGSRRSDLIQLRTLAEAAAWVLEQQPELALEGGKLNRGQVRGVIPGGKGDDPGPGKPAAPASPAANDPGPPVDVSARRHVDAHEAKPANRAQRAAAARAARPRVELGDDAAVAAERAAAEAAASVEEIQRDLARRLEAGGLDASPLEGDDPATRHAAG